MNLSAAFSQLQVNVIRAAGAKLPHVTKVPCGGSGHELSPPNLSHEPCGTRFAWKGKRDVFLPTRGTSHLALARGLNYEATDRDQHHSRETFVACDNFAPARR